MRAGKNHGKKFQSRLVVSFSGIVYSAEWTDLTLEITATYIIIVIEIFN